jgi:hypothetical protein
MLFALRDLFPFIPSRQGRGSFYSQWVLKLLIYWQIRREQVSWVGSETTNLLANKERTGKLGLQKVEARFD